MSDTESTFSRPSHVPWYISGLNNELIVFCRMKYGDDKNYYPSTFPSFSCRCLFLLRSFSYLFHNFVLAFPSPISGVFFWQRPPVKVARIRASMHSCVQTQSAAQYNIRDSRIVDPNFARNILHKPIRVVARSKAWDVFAHSNAGIVGSNPTQDMVVCLHVFCFCLVLCR
jgi:hypothetical protein